MNLDRRIFCLNHVKYVNLQDGISPAADKMRSAYLQATGQTDTLILKATKIGP